MSGAARRRALEALADQHKRRGELDRATALWRELAEDDGLESIRALHELAMMHEHHERDFAEALSRCSVALERLEGSYHLPLTFRERWQRGFVHRRARLERRLRGNGR